MFDIFGAINGAIQCIANGFDCLANLAQDAWNTLGSFWQGITNIPQVIGNAFRNAVNAVQSAVGSLVDNIWDALQGAWNTVQQFFTNVWNGIQNAFNVVAQWIQNIGQGILGGLQWIGASLIGAVQAAGQWLMNGLQTIWGGLTGLAQWVWNSFKEFIGNLINQGIGDLGQVQKKIGEGLVKASEALADEVEGLFKAPIDALKAAWEGSGWLDTLYDWVFPNLPQVTTAFIAGEVIRSLAERARRGTLSFRSVLSSILTLITSYTLSYLLPSLLGDNKTYAPSHVVKPIRDTGITTVTPPEKVEEEEVEASVEATAVVPIQQTGRTVLASFVPSKYQIAFTVRPNQTLYVTLASGIAEALATTAVAAAEISLSQLIRAELATQATAVAEIVLGTRLYRRYQTAAKAVVGITIRTRMTRTLLTTAKAIADLLIESIVQETIQLVWSVSTSSLPSQSETKSYLYPLNGTMQIGNTDSQAFGITTFAIDTAFHNYTYSEIRINW